MTSECENLIPHQYLVNYIGQDSAPGFCVLLTGPWGAGKTHFIKSFQESLKSEKQFLYVSLNGIQSIDQVNDEFYRILNPKLGGETAGIAGSLLKQSIKAGTRFEIDTKVIRFFKSVFTKYTNHILIFDDLERCEIPIEEQLGFLNKLVEHNSAKIILIANEQELIDRHKNYPKIKEKLIGITLELNTSPVAVIDEAASGMSKKLLELIQRAKPSITEVFEKSEYKNLRNIKQSFLNFEISFAGLEDEYYKKSDLLERLLCVYLIISIEIKAGRLMPHQISSLRTSQMKYTMRQVSKQGAQEDVPIAQTLINKYSSRLFQDRVLSDEFWEQLFARGYLPTQDIVDAIKGSSYYYDTNSPNWMKLWEMYRIDDAEFNRLRDLVRSQFNSRNIITLDEALQISGLLLHLSGKKLISEPKGSILGKAKKIMCQLKNRNQLPEKITRDHYSNDFTSSNGLGFMDRDTPEFQRLAKFASKMIDQQFERSLPTKLDAILEDIENTEASDFYEIYASIVGHLRPYELTPLLHLSNANAFCRIITKQNRTIIPTCTALHDRYKSDYHAQHLTIELNWLKELRHEFTNEARVIDRTGSKAIIRSAVEHQIDPAISKLEEAKSALR